MNITLTQIFPSPLVIVDIRQDITLLQFVIEDLFESMNFISAPTDKKVSFDIYFNLRVFLNIAFGTSSTKVKTEIFISGILVANACTSIVFPFTCHTEVYCTKGNICMSFIFVIFLMNCEFITW